MNLQNQTLSKRKQVEEGSIENIIYENCNKTHRSDSLFMEIYTIKDPPNLCGYPWEGGRKRGRERREGGELKIQLCLNYVFKELVVGT